MYLRQLQLRHFRNYTDQQLQLISPKTILVGDNAQGKSNLLEAVELLATMRSHRATRDRELVQNEQPQGSILATVERTGIGHELAIALSAQSRRVMKVDGQIMRRQTDFLGQVNAVIFSSLDLDLVRGGPQTRRTWLDGILIQLEPIYASACDQYRHILRQRNALLRQPGAGQGAVLKAWDHQLVDVGSKISRRRARLLARLQPLAQSWHQLISGGQESLTLDYQPQVAPIAAEDPAAVVEERFWQEIQARAIAEQARGNSLVGPHRDEVALIINDTPARTYGSQGQQRTLVLALKLAELQLIEAVIGEPPLLLLDDVLAELDPRRQDQLLEAIMDRVQTLVTTTHLGNFDARWLQAAQVIKVQSGQLLL